MNLLEHTRALIAELNPAQARRYDFIHSPISSWPEWAVQDFQTIATALETVRAQALCEGREKADLAPTLREPCYARSTKQ
jgi:hypothetical protein